MKRIPLRTNALILKHTHGTGCTFSAVITAELAKGRSIKDAVKSKRVYFIKY